MKTIQFPLKAGLVAGLVLIVYTAVLYAFDVNIFHWAFSIFNGLITLTIIIVAAVMGTNRMRDIDMDGKIKYLQAWLGCIIAIVVAVWLSSLFSFVLNEYIDPDYMAKKVEEMIYSFEKMGLPDAEIDKIIDRMEGQLKPVKALVSSLWISPATAIVLGAIVAAFIKKDKTDNALV